MAISSTSAARTLLETLRKRLPASFIITKKTGISSGTINAMTGSIQNRTATAPSAVSTIAGALAIVSARKSLRLPTS